MGAAFKVGLMVGAVACCVAVLVAGGLAYNIRGLSHDAIVVGAIAGTIAFVVFGLIGFGLAVAIKW